ncbi:STAS domain-containing protein [Skermania sp. ID1734]|uniref:STAS domain-containing protein n=1 Tax=Skermania sp. ID1734 TaxID=2597516 RepID=UPI00117CCBBD|nr:STAS domain-containing protein [Skermania sp. ID1734]TSD99454.1 STAS domain-containing protein [Skermania sp. ID1734]
MLSNFVSELTTHDDLAEEPPRAGSLGTVSESPGVGVRAERISSSTLLISVDGEVDMLTAPSLAAFLDRQIGPGRKIVLDLSGCAFFGSAGLSLLSGLDRAANREGMRWALVVGRSVRRLLMAAQAAERYPVYTSFDAALAAVTHRGS